METIIIKKRTDDDIKKQIDLVIGDDRACAEKALRHLIDNLDFDFEELLKARSMEKDLNIGLSAIKYQDIAPLVGLNPLAKFYDAPLFDLHRSRIPTSLLKEIVTDIDTLFMHFGTLTPTLFQQRLTVDASSRILAPIFNRLVAEFSGTILNTPESFTSGHITSNRVNYQFKTCGFLTVVFVQVDRYAEGGYHQLSAIAQVIEKCHAGNQQQSGIRYGILYNGYKFRFFLFDGSTKPYKFSEGVLLLPGSRFYSGLELVGFSSAHPFVLLLRPICEILFNLFLVTYCATLKEFREKVKTTKHEWLGSLAKWDQAINLAEEALEKSQRGEALRQDNSIIDADASAETALKALKQSVDLLPENFKIKHQMDDLDWDELAKV